MDSGERPELLRREIPLARNQCDVEFGAGCYVCDLRPSRTLSSKRTIYREWNEAYTSHRASVTEQWKAHERASDNIYAIPTRFYHVHAELDRARQ
jgi:hypothetical protein